MKSVFEFESSGGTSVLAPPKPRLRPIPVPDKLDPPPMGPPDDFDDEGGGGFGGWGGGDDAGGDDEPTPPPSAPESFETGTFALGLLLAGIGILFTILIAVWLFLRREAGDWAPLPDGIPNLSLWSGTLLLAVSSLTIEHAARIAHSALAKDRSRVFGWLTFSIGLGVAFVGVQVGMLTGMWSEDNLPSSSGYGAVFYALTGLHALHIAAGLGYEFVVLARWRAEPGAPPHRHGIRLAAIFWHFMGLLWAILFTLLYFVR